MTTMELWTSPSGQGASEAHEYWCRVCGYGIVVRAEPPACPMCRASAWDPRLRPTR